nr:rhodanese-like domain-containing protein [Desulfobulbaceae bacterium]
MKRIALVFVALLTLNACSKNDTEQKGTVSPQSTNVLASTNNPLTSSQGANQKTKSVYTSITPAETQQLIKQRKDLLIVDVRSPEELKEGKIKDSQLLPFWNIMKGQHQLPRNRPLLLVCAVGGRSYGAMQILSRQGYPEIYNLKGGISDWKNARLPVIY